MAKLKPIHLDFNSIYRTEDAALHLERQDFRFTALRPGLGNISMDEIVESVEWRDEGNALNMNTIPVMRGTLTYRRPDTYALRFKDGHSLKCEVFWGGKWTALWQMRLLTAPEVEVTDKTLTVELADDLVLASKSTGRFRYTKSSRSHPKGWLYHEIVLDVCKRYRIPVGYMVKGKRRFPHFDPGEVSPLECIRQAVEKEQEYTGRRFLIAWRPDAKGRFGIHITHPHRNRTVYVLGNQITGGQSAPVHRAMLATAVTAFGSIKKPHGKREKFTHREVASDAVRQFGYIERRVHVGGNIESRQDVIDRAKHELAKNLRPVRNFTGLQHPGIAFLRRGDTVKLNLPTEGYSGNASFMFVTSVTHSLSGENYTMALDLTWRDPLDPNKLRAERNAAERALKRAQRRKAS